MQDSGLHVAVVGMAGAFPGASSVQEYWSNLCQGKECIKRFTREELLNAGVPLSFLNDENYVPVASVLEDADLFAANFFGYSARDAELLDPQQRLFLECCWTALEDAGYAPRRFKVPVGIFAGASMSSYLLFNVLQNLEGARGPEEFQAMLGTDKDFLSTRVAYELNLKGPCVTVQSGCSTSLVAIHLAVQSLLTYQCDTAIAGGVSVGVPQRRGYIYQPGGLLSPDGHCRTFDKRAAGTVFGEGVATVVLKRLADAIQDRDTIRAVILGTATNNDGSGKLGFTAPSTEGQAEVISRAHDLAEVSSDSIGYVEAHGTATSLGDPIELAALTKAFRRGTKRKQFCGVGSVKSNIGHLDAAAGIAGFIKAVLMLKYREFVPSVNYVEPNERLELRDSPFYVVSSHESWHSEGPRRAGVSSFGIGGTNAHVVLQEPPSLPMRRDERPIQIISVSAKTEAEAEAAASNVIGFINDTEQSLLPDVAFTLHLGREEFEHRRSKVFLKRSGSAYSCSYSNFLIGRAVLPTREVAFLFPGGGTQYPNMGKELYETEYEFRRNIDLCSSLLAEESGSDLRRALYPPLYGSEAHTTLAKPSQALPALFATEYSLAKLLIHWGVTPKCMIGHSLGEYAAACLAGVFSLEDALRLVHLRGVLLDKVTGCGMISIHAPVAEIREMVSEHLSIAAVNAPRQCVIAGDKESLEGLASQLVFSNIEFQHLHIQAAAHSKFVEPHLETLRVALSKVELKPPHIPFISNLSGTWAHPEAVTDPDYWVQHFRHTVRFSEGISTLLNNDRQLCIEVGPSHTLSALAREVRPDRAGSVHPTMPHAKMAGPGATVLYETLARMWNEGVSVDWTAFYGEQARQRVPLPTYPFERDRYWLSHPVNLKRSPVNARSFQDPRLHHRTWVRLPLQIIGESRHASLRTFWVIVPDSEGLGEALQDVLDERGSSLACISLAEFSTNRLRETISTCKASQFDVIRIAHLSSMSKLSEDNDLFSTRGRPELLDFLELVKTTAETLDSVRIEIVIVTNAAFQVGGSDLVCPLRATIAVVPDVIAHERPNLSVRVIDVDSGTATARSIRSRQISDEASLGEHPLVAYRGVERWVPEYCLLPKSFETAGRRLRDKGVYLFIGGLGVLGPIVAKSFASRSCCRIVLTSRNAFPKREEWLDWLSSHTFKDPISDKIRSIQEIEAAGTEIEIHTADATNLQEMTKLLNHIETHWGRINGVLHLAGITGSGALRLISDLEEEECQRQFAPKVKGCQVLADLLEKRDLDFCVVFSSTAALLGGAGMMAYAAANAFVDSFVAAKFAKTGQRWISVNWDAWNTGEDNSGVLTGMVKSLDVHAIPAQEATEVLHLILALHSGGPVAVSITDLNTRQRELREHWRYSHEAKLPGTIKHERPIMSTEYVPPGTALEKNISVAWQEILGLDKVGVNDNLFELGGNSLIALRILSRVRETSAITISLASLFESPTIRALARSASSETDAMPIDQAVLRGRLRRQAGRHRRPLEEDPKE